MIALTFALLFLTLFLFGRGYWQHIALPKLQNQRLKLQLVRVKRQGQYLKLWLQHPDGCVIAEGQSRSAYSAVWQRFTGQTCQSRLFAGTGLQSTALLPTGD